MTAGPPAGLLDGDVEVFDVLDPRMPDLLERLIGELRLEREHEPLRRLSRRVGDDVELDRDAIAVVATHGRRLSAATSYPHGVVIDRRRGRMAFAELKARQSVDVG